MWTWMSRLVISLEAGVYLHVWGFYQKWHSSNRIPSHKYITRKRSTATHIWLFNERILDFIFSCETFTLVRTQRCQCSASMRMILFFTRHIISTNDDIKSYVISNNHHISSWQWPWYHHFIINHPEWSIGYHKAIYFMQPRYSFSRLLFRN